MKKLILCFSFVCAGMLTSCVDKNELVDEDSLPEWLGSSIYGELKNPKPGNGLTGTFNTYLRLVDDLGYAETLNRTGSKTVFPANDEAFERFFANETWPGVRRYEDLSEAQKKMLLYNSMLDNALLIGMLGNSSSNDGVLQGRSLKHGTSATVIDTVTTYPFIGSVLAAYGENNPNWTRFKNGISVVTDATRPMLVHFTREYMLNNSITTAGASNDFSIVTGGNYEEGDAYIFGNRIPGSAQDVTCQNGYIHQVQDVVTPPGNMAQLIKRDKGLSIFSHMLDRFAVPVYNPTVTNNYHDWYKAQSEVRDMSGVANPDSIFEVRYLSKISHGTGDDLRGNVKFNKNVNGADILDENLLTMDPGWNEFYVAPASAAAPETFLADLAAMFVPTDSALIKFFTEEDGKSILDTYGTLPNTPENVYVNVETVPMNIIAKFISNVLKTSFVASVPSKFASVVDDAKDQMGLTLNSLKRSGNGYDVRVANNGVVYVTDEVFPPKAYVAVSAPALFSKEMNVTNWIIQNVTYGNIRYALNLDYYAYLLTMASNYALFLPTDKAFDTYYLDPASLGREDGTRSVFHYYYTPDKESGISVSRFNYNERTGEVSDSMEIDINGAYNASDFAIVRSHLSDLIQFCTVVLKSGEKLGTNKFYKTKHGGAIRIDGNNGTDLNNAYVASGGQIVANPVGVSVPAQITEVFGNQRNGVSYKIDRLIQGPTKSVYKVLSENPQLSEFFDLCRGFNPEILEWVGISSQKDQVGLRPIDQYKLFHVPGEYESQRRCVDQNVKMFSNYNYTVYAPNNDAMQFAYEHGLPKWDDVNALYEEYFVNADAEKANSDAADLAKEEAKRMIEAIKRFTRYHFHNTSLYIDNVVDVKADGSEFLTFLTDRYSINKSLTIKGGNNKIQIQDATSMPKEITLNSGLVNEMTRDFEFDQDRRSATRVTASSFAVVHELNAPLYYNKAATAAEIDYSKDVDVASAKYHK